MSSPADNSEVRDRRLRILTAARLINKSVQNEFAEDMYASACRCYEILLELLEDKQALEEISIYLTLPSEQIKTSADEIVTRMLFNIDNDPFISLGLRVNAPVHEIERRRKRLLMLFHPDRAGTETSGDKATKINEAFEKIIKPAGYFSRRKSNRTLAGSLFGRRRHRRSVRGRFLKKLPIIVITIMIAAALISILLFIRNQTEPAPEQAVIKKKQTGGGRDAGSVIIIPLSVKSARVLRIELLDEGTAELLYDGKCPMGNTSPMAEQRKP